MTLSSTDRWRRFWYLQSLEIRLEGMPGKRRRAVVRELGASLELAAGEQGMRSAITDLGRPAVLARQYLEQEPERRPRWSAGALAAALVLGWWLYSTLFYTAGMLDALHSTGVTVPATGSFFGTSVVATFNDGEISAGFRGWPWAATVLVLLTFLLVGRCWNALPGRRSRTPAAA